MIKKSIIGLVVGLCVLMAANACAECVASCPEGTSDFNGFCYAASGGEALIIAYAGSDTDVEIPSVINGNSVNSIGLGAFQGCTSLTSVTIPDSVTSFDLFAFASCTSLTSVTIPDSVNSIGLGAFSGCTSLTSVTIPDSVSIGGGAFYGCTSLTSVTIPGFVGHLGDYTFYGCTSLTSVTIGNRITGIGDYTFYGCTSLTSVTIPDSVSSIGRSAFYGCTSLTSVTIPDSVTHIRDGAFLQCTSLAVAYFLGDAPVVEGGVFEVSAPGFKVCRTAGAAGFDMEPWLSYNAQVCEQCEDNSNCSEGYACVDGACVEDQPPIFISEPLWVGPWVGLSSDPINPHKPQSKHILFWAYDDDRLACPGGAELSWKYRPVELQEGVVVALGDWVVKEPWRYLRFAWIETPGIADIPGPGLFEFKMTATDCMGQMVDSEGFWGKRYYFQVD